MTNRVLRPAWSKPSRRAAAENLARRQKAREAVRNTGVRDLYFTVQWRALRARVIREQPFCATRGCGKRTRVVDHARPHRGDLQLFFDRSNLVGYCKPCHDRKTARFDGGFGNPRRSSVKDPTP